MPDPDHGRRGPSRRQADSLKQNADAALAACPDVHTCLVVKRTGGNIGWQEGAISGITRPPRELPPSARRSPWMPRIRCSSCTRPVHRQAGQGVLHTTGGCYLLQAAMTFKYVFDYRAGRNLLVHRGRGLGYRPHLYRLRPAGERRHLSLIFEGVPTYPDAGAAGKWWINTRSTRLYRPTFAPHAVGNELVTRSSRASLRLLGTVGEPINPEAWNWYHRGVGTPAAPSSTPVRQTETGARMITPCPAPSREARPATVPFSGSTWRCSTRTVRGPGAGAGYPVVNLLALADPHRIRAITSYGRYLFQNYPGYYFTGEVDAAPLDYRPGERLLNVSGQYGNRHGGALVLHDNIARRGPHDIKGRASTPMSPHAGVEPSEELRAELIACASRKSARLPSPMSSSGRRGCRKRAPGKIMRRILRRSRRTSWTAWATPALADPTVVGLTWSTQPASIAHRLRQSRACRRHALFACCGMAHCAVTGIVPIEPLVARPRRGPGQPIHGFPGGS